MSLKKIATTAVVTASLLAGNIATMTTAANADGWGRRDGYAYRHDSPRHWDRSDWDRRSWDRGRWSRHSAYDRYRDRRDDRRDRRAIALGVTALFLGAIIASSANDHGRRHYRDYD